MEFSVRRYYGYDSLSITHGGTTMTTGLLDSEEVANLCQNMQEALDDFGYVSPRQLELEEALKKIYEYAHDNSSGPVSPDKLWEVRLIVEEVL